MTLEEIEKKCESIFEGHLTVSARHITCFNCKKQCIRDLEEITERSYIFEVVFRCFTNGYMGSKVFFDRVASRTEVVAVPVYTYSYMSGICSKKCLIEFIFNNQDMLVELITQ
jgi:hypothetical protein